MRKMRSILVFSALALGLAGCGMLGAGKSRPQVEPIVAPVEPVQTLPALGSGQAAGALDKTTEAEKVAALAKPSGAERVLGKSVVALGSPAEQGFWLKSALVAAPGKGRVETAGGASVSVDLIPGSGGALLSLAAFRALGLALTELPEVTIFAQ